MGNSDVGKPHPKSTSDAFQEAGKAYPDRVCAAFDVLVEAFIGNSLDAELVASTFKQVCQRDLPPHKAHEVLCDLL